MKGYLAILCALATTSLLTMPAGPVLATQKTTQAHVHEMSSSVMPFDISRVLHIFRMTETGGVERIVSRDPRDSQQIALIRQHLKREAKRFQAGNYSDPARLHGANMPGLKLLESGASAIRISYRELPVGAEIVFSTHSIKLLTAIHRWFGAQLSEHGADAKAE